jgi:pimeloyl-ACP methyl ester carboxylesterase
VLLEQLAILPVGLLGCSFGAQVAAELALRQPDLVAALILARTTIDPSPASVRGQIRRLLLDAVHEDPQQTRILAADIHDAGVRRILGTLRHALRHPMTATLRAIYLRPPCWCGGAPTGSLREDGSPMPVMMWCRRVHGLGPRVPGTGPP